MSSIRLKIRQLLLGLTILQLSFFKLSFACIKSYDAYPDQSSVDPAAENFDEFSYLVLNYEQGMVIDSATVCQKDFSGTTFLIGIQLNLINRSTGQTSTGSYYGLSQADYPGDSTVVCETKTTTGTVDEVTVGVYVYTSSFLMRVNSIKLSQKPVGSIEFGDLGVAIAQQTWNFDLSNGGFIGLYGYYTEMLNSLGPYYNPGNCDCSETILKSSAILDMASSITTGSVSTQTITPFPHTYEEQGRGSCGSQTYTIQQTDGSSCASFLTISGDQLLMATTNSGLIGQYEIRMTVVMDDYPTISTTEDFTVYVLELGPDSSYVSSRELRVLEGPYTEVNTCFTQPDFGFTFLLGVSGSSLPSYATIDSQNFEVVSDPRSNDNKGDTYNVMFTCELSEFVETMGVVQMPVAFTVVENTDICVDPYDLNDPTCCLDPFDLADPTCCPDPSDTNDTNCCPDPSDLSDSNCQQPVCPDPYDLTDTTCCLDPFVLTDPTCCPDPSNTSDPNCCPDPSDTDDTNCPVCPDPFNLSDTTCCLNPLDLSDPTCCPDPTNLSDPNCCPDPSNLSDPKCCPDPFNLSDTNCCPDKNNLSDTNCCPDPNNASDPNCPVICPFPYDYNDPTCCLDPTNTADPTCCPDPNDTSDPNCPTACPDPFDLSDTSCCPDPYDTSDSTCCPDPSNTLDPNCNVICPDPYNFADPTCCVNPSNKSDPTCCPDPQNTADPNCPQPEPVICPDPSDTTDPTCPDPEPEDECPDSTNPECEDYVAEEIEEEELEIHEYYIPSGGGPILNDYFAFQGTLTDRFVLKGLNDGFEWSYAVYNEDPVDTLFVEYWGDRSIDYTVDLACNYVSFFVNCSISDDLTLIHLNSTGVTDEALFGTTFPINIYMENEIEQKSEYRIEVIVVSEGNTDKEEQDAAIIVEDIRTIDSIVVDSAFVDIKGHLTIKFKEFVTANSTESDSRRVLQATKTTYFDDELVLSFTIDETKNGLDDEYTVFTSDIIYFNEEMTQVQLDFEYPESISSFETDIMTIEGRVGDKVLFTQNVDLPPQVDKDYFLVGIIEFAAYITVLSMGGTVVLAFLLDLIFFQRFKYQALFQAIEVWQQVCYVQLLGVPLPGYVLLYTPELMPAINFDVFHFLEKYWRDFTLFELVHNEELLGVNFITFGFNSVHYFQNARSAVGLTGVTIILLFFVSTFGCCSKRTWKYMVASFIVFLKSAVYMVLVLSATIQLRYNGDDGLQTALAIITQCFLALALPIYFTVNSCRERKFPSRSNLTLALRALTAFAVAYGTDYPIYQFLFLEAIHVLFVVFTMARFNKYSTARSLGLSVSYGVLPTLIFSLRFDQSGLFSTGFTALILAYVTLVHIFVADLNYQCRLSSARRQYAKQRRSAKQQLRKKQLAKKRNKVMPMMPDENLPSGQLTPHNENSLSKVEMHGFGLTETETQQDEQLLQGNHKIVMPLALLNGKNKSQVVPIMEVPSSDSDRSSIKPTNPPTHLNSVRSSDPDSFGFIPRDNAQIHTTSMNGDVLATGAGMLITAEGDAEEDKKEQSQQQHGRFASGEIYADGNRLAQSLNFSNGAGKISKIDFLHGENNHKEDIISFKEIEEVKDGGRRSDFNEDLLNSSNSDQARPIPPAKGSPSGEFSLKKSKRTREMKIDKEIDIEIDIEWPAKKIQEEYERQLTQKNQLLFGPNWQFQGEKLDIDLAKKELYKWKRDEGRQRSMAIAQEPSIVDSQEADDTKEKKSPVLTNWVADLLVDQGRSSMRASSTLEKDSMAQEILKEYQSVPHDESILNREDPLVRLPKHQRVNTASMEQYLTRSSPKRSRESQLFAARELQLFSRNKKKRENYRQ